MTVDNIEVNFNKEVHRGEIWFMSYGQTTGSEMSKARPVVIVSNELCNEHSPVCTVVPITSKDKKPLPTHVEVPTTQDLVHGLILCEQITTTSKTRLINYVGEVDDKTMRKIEDCICIQCAIDQKQAQAEPTVLQASSEKDELIEKLRDELLHARSKVAMLEQSSSDNVSIVKDLQEKLAKMTERAKIFEELYKEEVKK